MHFMLGRKADGGRDLRRLAIHGALILTLGACATSARAAQGTATLSSPGPSSQAAPGLARRLASGEPAVIDTRYVQQVIDRLDVIYGDAFRALEADRVLDPRVGQLLGDAFQGVALAGKVADFTRETHSGFSLVRSNPGNPQTVVLNLVSTERGCVLARTRRSLASAYQPGFNTGLAYVYVALRPTAPTADLVNETGWRIGFDGARMDDSGPTDACSAS